MLKSRISEGLGIDWLFSLVVEWFDGGEVNGLGWSNSLTSDL